MNGIWSKFTFVYNSNWHPHCAFPLCQIRRIYMKTARKWVSMCEKWICWSMACKKCVLLKKTSVIRFSKDLDPTSHESIQINILISLPFYVFSIKSSCIAGLSTFPAVINFLLLIKSMRTNRTHFNSRRLQTSNQS